MIEISVGFFLLAMISLSLFTTITRQLSHLPHIQEKLIRALLIPLAIADVSPIAFPHSSEIREP